MIKNISTGGIIPDKRMTVYKGQPVEIKRTYKIVDSQPVIVWDIDDIGNSFITTWQITAGEFTFPDLEYTSRKGTIDWGDGSDIEEYDSNQAISHTYAVSGQYTIVIDCEVKEIKERAFFKRTDLISIKCITVDTFGERCFAACSKLQTAIFSDESTQLASYMLQGSSKLSFFNFPKKLETISYGAFYSSGISGDLIIPNSVKNIMGMAFDNCHELTSIKIPDTVSYLQYNEQDTSALYSYQFYNCYNIQSIEIGENYSQIEHIPSNFIRIESQWQEKQQLQTIKIAEGIKTIGGKGQVSFSIGVASSPNINECYVYLPSTITKLGRCFSSPHSTDMHGTHKLYINYNGTLADWQKISFDSRFLFYGYNGSGGGSAYLITKDGNTYAINNDGTIK